MPNIMPDPGGTRAHKTDDAEPHRASLPEEETDQNHMLRIRRAVGMENCDSHTYSVFWKEPQADIAHNSAQTRLRCLS